MSSSRLRRCSIGSTLRSVRSSVIPAVTLCLALAACDAGSTATEVGGAEALQLSAAVVDLAAGESHRLAATGEAASGVNWRSESPEIATVDAAGLVTARAPGETTILASSSRAKASARIKVRGKKVNVASVSVSPDAGTTTAIGDTIPLSVVVRDPKGSVVSGAAVTWSSLNSDVATVNGSGRVVSRAVGTALIVVTAGGKADTATITSRQVVTSVAVTPASGEVDAGGTLRFQAKAADRRGVDVAGTSFVWQSSNTTVATVDHGGVVKGVAGGSATITARAGGESGTATATVRAAKTETPPPPPSSSGSDLHPNKPTGLTHITTHSGRSLTEDGWYHNGSNNVTILSGSKGPVAGSQVIQYRYPAGHTGGSGVGRLQYGSGSAGAPNNIKTDGKHVREIYLSYWFRLDPNWQAPASGESKLFYVYAEESGVSRNHIFPIINGTSALRMQFRNMVNENPERLGGNVSSPEIKRGVWYHLEIHARNASALGAKDGLLRWWINGDLAGDYPNIDRPALPWSQVHGNMVWGGTGGVVQRDQYIWLNHIYLAGRP